MLQDYGACPWVAMTLSCGAIAMRVVVVLELSPTADEG